ncbi:hypothetical protein [Caulobacter endophyticus]|uniref:hypothetical protein n=1 Tax=Caulobacter endophyticus TaxID=2172652 RepID=UPI0011B28824|nr:hypothetical protein [Caulobacter endophyticus]
MPDGDARLEEWDLEISEAIEQGYISPGSGLDAFYSLTPRALDYLAASRMCPGADLEQVSLGRSPAFAHPHNAAI